MRFLVVVFLLTTAIFMNRAKAQQQAMYTQYMFDQLLLNPAYAGSHDVLSLTALARYQWTGVDGAPNTQTLSGHSPIMDRAGVGLVVSNDEIGPSSQLNLTGIYSYKIRFAYSSLRFGLQASVAQYKENLTGLSSNNGPDVSFSQNINEFAPNFGAGVYFENSRFYAGLSSPFLLNNVFGDESTSFSKLRQHFFLTAGYVMDLSPYLKLKPNVLVKAVGGAPVEFDLNANFLVREVLWLGVSYRSLDSFDFLIEMVLSERFRVGYAYDQTVTDLKRVSGGTHEFMLNYKFEFSGKKIHTPRYF